MFLKNTRMTWEKCFRFCVLIGNMLPKSNLFGCRCFLFFRYTHNLGKMFPLKKKKQNKIESKMSVR